MFRSVRRFWRSTAPVVRHTFAPMWAMGLTLTAAGWTGDDHGFWADKPFMTNLVSSLTGAMFGIPVALVVIQRVASRQANHAESHALAAQVTKSAADLHAIAVAMALGSDNQDRLREIEKKLRKASAGLLTAERYSRPPDEATRMAVLGLGNQCELFLPNPPEYGVLLRQAAREIARLNVLRTRALEIGAPWAEAEALENIRPPDTDARQFGEWRSDAFRVPADRLPADGPEWAPTIAALTVGIHEVGDINHFIGTTLGAWCAAESFAGPR
ncbi:hypothetical protein ACFQFC_08885 [Amorphoplanes digitatis]|uniref:Uncharacterized protein n=1 Tax=Actinoplanes digitatis TaxID=1868 RepID=A0A7W7I0Q3_9ACTN|nr:hypothetical protein [Actinoplanes digitatis]MBB4764324.1 hypothetical protein [Actinoplanes digitatis]